VTVLLDTHVLLWWLADAGDLSREQVAELERAERSGGGIAVAAISLWEIAMLAERGRVRLPCTTDAFLDELERAPSLRVLPLDRRVAVESVRLGDAVPRDPSDRMIVATARVWGLPLVTADERIRQSGAVRVI
jgi:PIN domain nuclease of toxin-antitoxin system